MALRPLIVAASAAVFLALAGDCVGSFPGALGGGGRRAHDARRGAARARPGRARQGEGARSARRPRSQLGAVSGRAAEARASPTAEEAVRRRGSGRARDRAGGDVDGHPRPRRPSRAIAAAAAGDVDEARAWLLVREFRTPTRFTRPGADATLALQCARGRPASAAGAAAAAVRADLLDTYQARLRAALEDVAAAGEPGLRRAAAPGAAALARGYFAISRRRLREAAERPPRPRRADRPLRRARGGRAGRRSTQRSTTALEDDRRRRSTASARRRSAEEEKLRRAGQLQRFLALVPIEYGRGVDDGRVTLDFEIQEAITFRDGAAQALRRPRAPARARADAGGHAAGSASSSTALGSRPGRGRAPATPSRIRTTSQAATDEALALIDGAVSRRVEGGRGDRRLRRHLGHARPARGRGRGRAVRTGRAGAARGLRVLRVRPRAAAPRASPRTSSSRSRASSGTARTGFRASRSSSSARRSPRGGRGDPQGARRARSPTPRRRSAPARPRRSRSSRTPRSSSSGRASRPC